MWSLHLYNKIYGNFLSPLFFPPSVCPSNARIRVCLGLLSYGAILFDTQPNFSSRNWVVSILIVYYAPDQMVCYYVCFIQLVLSTCSRLEYSLIGDTQYTRRKKEMDIHSAKQHTRRKHIKLSMHIPNHHTCMEKKKTCSTQI